MHRVDTSTAAASLPTVEAAGTPGYFTKGNPATSEAATVPAQDWFNMVQEELVHVVVQAGLSLSTAKTDFSQLYTAIVMLISTSVNSATELVKGIAEIATQAETDAGVDDLRFVTPLKLRFGFSSLMATNGYIVFPSWLGGLIFQWGKSGAVSQNSSITVTYTIPFPSAVFAGIATADVDGVSASSAANFISFGSLTGATLRNSDPDSGYIGIFYVSIGN